MKAEIGVIQLKPNFQELGRAEEESSLRAISVAMLISRGSP
jgi:hypothetical protein